MPQPPETSYPNRVSPRDYLIRERHAREMKSEYVDGRIRALGGATRAHNLIVMNLGAALHHQTKNGPCEVYPSDMRVHVRRTGIYAYPDVTIVCGKPEIVDDEWKDTLLNPTMLVEVLSPSTERYDRFNKTINHYRRLESLAAYLLVAQDKPVIDRWARAKNAEAHQNGTWIHSEVRGLDATLDLPTIGCQLRLSDVFHRVI